MRAAPTCNDGTWTSSADGLERGDFFLSLKYLSFPCRNATIYAYSQTGTVFPIAWPGWTGQVTRVGNNTFGAAGEGFALPPPPANIVCCLFVVENCRVLYIVFVFILCYPERSCPTPSLSRIKGKIWNVRLHALPHTKEAYERGYERGFVGLLGSLHEPI